ncbi:MAG TPA: hypothetical protein VFQ26_06660 [Nitrospiraceae bacterium]|nr:hypothetical protein [Nitrospiraceae bacterium]
MSYPIKGVTMNGVLEADENQRASPTSHYGFARRHRAPACQNAAIDHGAVPPRSQEGGLREVNQSLDWFDLVLVFTTPCASGAGAEAGLLSGGVLSGGVVSRLFWILERDLVTLAASGAGVVVVGCTSAGLLAGSAALAVLATNPAATSDSVARTVSVRRIV